MNPMTVTDTRSAVAYVQGRIDGFLADAQRHVDAAERAATEVEYLAHMEAGRDALADAEALRSRLDACRVGA